MLFKLLQLIMTRSLLRRLTAQLDSLEERFIEIAADVHARRFRSFNRYEVN